MQSFYICPTYVGYNLKEWSFVLVQKYPLMFGFMVKEGFGILWLGFFFCFSILKHTIVNFNTFEFKLVLIPGSHVAETFKLILIEKKKLY